MQTQRGDLHDIRACQADPERYRIAAPLDVAKMQGADIHASPPGGGDRQIFNTQFSGVWPTAGGDGPMLNVPTRGPNPGGPILKSGAELVDRQPPIKEVPGEQQGGQYCQGNQSLAPHFASRRPDRTRSNRYRAAIPTSSAPGVSGPLTHRSYTTPRDTTRSKTSPRPNSLATV